MAAPQRLDKKATGVLDVRLTVFFPFPPLFFLAAPQRLDQNATGVLDVRLTAIDVIRRLALRGDRPVLGALMTFKNSLSGTPQEERLYSAVVEVLLYYYNFVQCVVWIMNTAMVEVFL